MSTGVIGDLGFDDVMRAGAAPVTVRRAVPDGPPRLSRLVFERRLSHTQTLRLLAQVADSLDFAHEAGVVHGDVRPQQVVVRPDGRARLVKPGEPAATRHYVAPEVARGEEPGAAADRYSFACTVFTCLTLRPPFDAPGDEELLRAHLHAEPPAAPGLPFEAQEALRAGLSKLPSERPACRELLEDVAASLDVALPAAPRPAAPDRFAPRPPAPRPAAIPRRETSRPRRSARGLGLSRLAALIALGAAGAAAGVLLASPPPKAVAPGPTVIGPVSLDLPAGWRRTPQGAAGDGATLVVRRTNGAPRDAAIAPRVTLPRGRTAIVSAVGIAFPVPRGWIRLDCSAAGRDACLAVAATARSPLRSRTPDPDPAVATRLTVALDALAAGERPDRAAIAAAETQAELKVATDELFRTLRSAAGAVQRAARPGSPAARATGPLAAALRREAAAARRLGDPDTFLPARAELLRARKSVEAALAGLRRRGY